MYTDPSPPFVKCTIFIQGQLIGCTEYPNYRTNGGRPRWINHSAFFCPVCGELWARRMVDAISAPDDWHCTHSRCEQCGGGFVLEPELLDSAAHDLLTREFLLAMQLGEWPQ